jgi:hypothetical protein
MLIGDAEKPSILAFTLGDIDHGIMGVLLFQALVGPVLNRLGSLLGLYPDEVMRLLRIAIWPSFSRVPEIQSLNCIRLNHAHF